MLHDVNDVNGSGGVSDESRLKTSSIKTGLGTTDNRFKVVTRAKIYRNRRKISSPQYEFSDFQFVIFFLFFFLQLVHSPNAPVDVQILFIKRRRMTKNVPFWVSLKKSFHGLIFLKNSKNFLFWAAWKACSSKSQQRVNGMTQPEIGTNKVDGKLDKRNTFTKISWSWKSRLKRPWRNSVTNKPIATPKSANSAASEFWFRASEPTSRISAQGTQMAKQCMNGNHSIEFLTHVPNFSEVYAPGIPTTCEAPIFKTT